MLFRLAFRNVRRQIGNYLIYFITVSLTVALLFSVNNFIYGDVMDEMLLQYERFADLIRNIALCLTAIMAAVVAFVLGYATVFLLRKRKREFGVCLTLGMTRGNVLKIFAGETGFTFLLSLGMGILLGLAAYQVLSAIFINFLNFEYAFAGYSLAGSFLTVGMAVCMFLLSSCASFFYLRFVRISRLLQGESFVSKKAGVPVGWIVLVLFSLAGIVGAVVFFYGWLEEGNYHLHLVGVSAAVVCFLFSAGLLPVGLSKTVIWILLRCKKITARGAGVFTLRQLFGRINASSLMMGVLSVLLVFALIGPNIFLTVNTVTEADLRIDYPYDVSAKRKTQSALPQDFAEDLRIIGEYAQIEASYSYTLYYGETGNERSEIVRASDFSVLCDLLGYTMPAWEGDCIFYTSFDAGADFVYTPGKRQTVIDGRTLSVGGTIKGAAGIIDWSSAFEFFVIADEVAEEMELTPFIYCLAVRFKNRRFDANALSAALDAYRRTDGPQECGESSYNGTSYTLFELERLYEVGRLGMVLFGTLFISAVFVLITMAMLALKILSIVAEDRERYRILRYLGASEGMLAKSLGMQMFFYCFLPFVVPLGICFPLVGALQRMISLSGVALSAGALALQVAATAGVVVLLYAVYFLAAYLAAWRDIKKTLRAVG